MDMKLILLGFLLGSIVLIWAFFIYNPNAPNPLNASASTNFKPVETTTKWEKAIATNNTVLVEKESNGLRPTPEELEKAHREYQEVAP